MDKNKLPKMQLENRGQTAITATQKPTTSPNPQQGFPLGSPAIRSTPKPTPPQTLPKKP